MAIEIVFQDDGGVLIVASGEVNAEDLYRVNQEAFGSPETVAALTYAIGDFSNVVTLDVKSSDIKRIAALDTKTRQTNPGIRLAVVGESDLVFGLARVWFGALDKEQTNSNVFRTLEDAKTWIRDKLAES